MGFLIFSIVLVAAAFVAGAFFRDQTISCFEKAWFNATASQAQRDWFAKNARKFKTFSEARAQWYKIDNPAAEKDRLKAEKRYDEFLRVTGRDQFDSDEQK